MFEITVKWPAGGLVTVGGFSADQVSPMRDFLWASGAEDVFVRCTCNVCETCSDRAIFESGV